MGLFVCLAVNTFECCFSLSLRSKPLNRINTELPEGALLDL